LLVRIDLPHCLRVVLHFLLSFFHLWSKSQSPHKRRRRKKEEEEGGGRGGRGEEGRKLYRASEATRTFFFSPTSTSASSAL